MARSLLPFVQNGYYASCNWIPLVKGNGFTTSGGGEQEEVWETASGPIVTFDAVPAPLRQLSVAVEPVQNLNGYDNPWPAGGGKNKISSYIVSSDLRYIDCLKCEAELLPDTEYTISFVGTAGNRIYGNENLFTQSLMYTLPSGRFSVTLTTKSILDKTDINQYTSGEGWRIFKNYDTQTNPNTASDVQICLSTASDPTAYSPYSNICPITGWDSVNIWDKPTHDTTATPTATIQLGKTVYGGTLDVLTGVLTVSHKYKKPPKADIRRNQDTQFYVVIDSEIAMGTEVPCISNKFRPWDGTESLYKKGYYCFVNSGGAIRFNTTAEYSTVDDMYNAIGEMEFICQLATPFELPLTPMQIATLQGTNNVWSDAGDVTVEYRAQ